MAGICIGIPHSLCLSGGLREISCESGQMPGHSCQKEVSMERICAKRERRSAKQLLKGTPEQVFPLLCPVREYDWIDGWDCKMIYTESGVAEENCIFVTSFPSEGPPETWTVIEYKPNSSIEFLRVNEIRTIRYRIELTDNGDGTTSADWSQLITALNSLGEEYLERVTEEKYRILIENLQAMINHYLTTGRKLPFENPGAHWEES